jgi:uncharacterized membrane protein YbjE (DUF340 family)
VVVGAMIALTLGIALGVSGFDIPWIDFVVQNADAVLYLLMFLVGISVGLNRGIFKQMRGYGVKLVYIIAGTVLGSILGGLLTGLLTDLSLAEGAAIASGLGWYSLSGVMLTEMAGAQLGSVAFLSNLMREIFSFFIIPWIARHLNYESCIAPAGATSEDTTLPMMIRYTDEPTVVLSVLHGMICSALVPVLIRLCYRLF